jgi:hypothetical protein
LFVFLIYFLIVRDGSLLVISSVYGFGGCLYKKFAMGAEGAEICPNVDFWMAFPGYVKQGCIVSSNWVKGKLFGGSNAPTIAYEEQQNL